jgi:tetratricopeptide (TPR) repeat protein
MPPSDGTGAPGASGSSGAPTCRAKAGATTRAIAGLIAGLSGWLPIAGAAAVVACAAGVAGAQQAADPDALWADGRRLEALQAWEARLAARPDDADLRRRLVERQMEAQRFAAALQTAAPLGPEVDGLRGRALYVLARYEEAVPLLRRDKPDAALMLVDALSALGRTDEARDALDDAAARLGEDHPRVLAMRGRDLAAQGRHAEAVPVFRRALERDPLDREALFGVGTSLARSGEREAGLAALQHHREILPLLDRRDFALQGLALDPGHADNLAALGDVERQLGLVDSAEQRYRDGLLRAHAGNAAPIALRLARLLDEDRHHAEAAVVLLDDVFARVPDVRLVVRAGDLLGEAGRWHDAVARYEQALALRPDDAQILARRDQAVAQAADGDGAAGGEPER